MIARSTKPNRCKHCKVRMPEDKARHVLHESCIAPWLEGQNAKKERARLKKAQADRRVEKAVDRQRKDAIKNVADLIEDAQKAFNAYIRARDAGRPCICCGKPMEPNKPGGSVDAGHFRSRGAAPHLRFDEANCHAQRKNCNRPGGTTLAAFTAGMVERVGQAEVDRLASDNAVHKWTKEELRAIRATYTQKLKDIKRLES